MMDSYVLKGAKDSSGNYDFSSLLANIKDQTANADLTVGTLTTTISGADATGGYTGSPKYNTPDTILAALKDAGFDVLNLAQTHIFDHGYDGMTSTMQAIEGQQMAHVGTYTSTDDYKAITPITPSGHNISVATLPYCYFASKPASLTSTQWNYAIKNITMTKIKSDITAARSAGAQIVVVMLNWGATTTTPSTVMVSEAQEIIKDGADVVIGCGSKLVEKMETVQYTNSSGISKSGIIAYSLGNFVSANTGTNQNAGLLLNIVFEKDNASNTITIKNASYVPTYVYKDTKTGVYSVLPASKYVDTDDLLSTLTSTAKARIKSIVTWMENLLGSTIASPVDAIAPPTPVDGGQTDNGQPTDTTQPDDSGAPQGTTAPTTSGEPDDNN